MSNWFEMPGQFRYAGRDMRIGDAERTEVTDILSRHFGDGRLDRTEFDERMESAMHAKTRVELDRLLVDLPRLDVPTARPEPRHHSPLRFLLLALMVAFVATVTLHVLWHAVAVWPLVLLVVFLVLRRRGHRGYRPRDVTRYPG